MVAEGPWWVGDFLYWSPLCFQRLFHRTWSLWFSSPGWRESVILGILLWLSSLPWNYRCTLPYLPYFLCKCWNPRLRSQKVGKHFTGWAILLSYICPFKSESLIFSVHYKFHLLIICYINICKSQFFFSLGFLSTVLNVLLAVWCNPICLLLLLLLKMMARSVSLSHRAILLRLICFLLSVTRGKDHVSHVRWTGHLRRAVTLPFKN